MRVRSRIHVEGVVHGVGFRPFVHALADEYGVCGLVGDDDAGVVIEAEGAPAAVTSLVDALTERPPPLAFIACANCGPRFSIVTDSASSPPRAGHLAPVPTAGARDRAGRTPG